MNKKNLRKLIPKWIRVSNRYKHLIYGGIVAILLYPIILLMVLNIQEQNLLALLLSFMTTGALGFGMEFKDRIWGGKFDLLDLLATVLIPLILIIIKLI